jgi:hypothetical protein
VSQANNRPGRFTGGLIAWRFVASEIAPPDARVRRVPGFSPVMSRNVRPNVPRLDHPVWNAMSVMGRSVSRSNAVARSMRRVSR